MGLDICQIRIQHGGFDWDRLRKSARGRDERDNPLTQDIKVSPCDSVHPGEEVVWRVDGWVQEDSGWVVETSFGREDCIRACFRKTSEGISWPEDVSVCKQDSFRWKVLAEMADVRPRRQACIVALLLPGPAVDREDRGAGGEHHACVLQCLLFRFKDADFRCDWDGEIGGCGAGQDEGVDQVPRLLQEGAVVSLPGDALRTAEVEVDGVDVWGDLDRGGEQVWGGIGAELGNQRAVVRGMAVQGGGGDEGAREVLVLVGRGAREEAGVEHGGIGEDAGVGLGRGICGGGRWGRAGVDEEAPGKVGVFHHWGEDGFRGA